VTLGAVLLAAISGAGGGLGTQLWADMCVLVRRPFRHRAAANQAATATLTGNTELTALERDPANAKRAQELAETLIGRANANLEFRQALDTWWAQARMLYTGDGNVTNTISGGNQRGPVLQGRDFGDITFGASPVQRRPEHPA
jgi:hypothetical protein